MDLAGRKKYLLIGILAVFTKCSCKNAEARKRRQAVHPARHVLFSELLKTGKNHFVQNIFV